MKFSLFLPFKICYSEQVTQGPAALKIRYRKAGAEDVEVLSRMRVDMLSADNGLSEALQSALYQQTKDYFLSGPKKSNLFFICCGGGWCNDCHGRHLLF